MLYHNIVSYFTTTLCCTVPQYCAILYHVLRGTNTVMSCPGHKTTHKLAKINIYFIQLIHPVLITYINQGNRAASCQADLILGNINIYLHFLSFLNTEIDGLVQERRNSIALAMELVFLAPTHRDGVDTCSWNASHGAHFTYMVIL